MSKRNYYSKRFSSASEYNQREFVSNDNDSNMSCSDCSSSSGGSSFSRSCCEDPTW